MPDQEPAALGTQVGGAIVRPAGFCGNVMLKPTQGGINRGERQATSMSPHGVHAGCLEDMWQVAIEIARRVGGDRGCAGLFGPPPTPPAAVQPIRLIVLETEGWTVLDDLSKAGFTQLLERLQRAGITLPRRAAGARGGVTLSCQVGTAGRCRDHALLSRIGTPPGW